VPGIQQCSLDVLSFSSLYCLPKGSMLVGVYRLSFYLFNEYLLSAIVLIFICLSRTDEDFVQECYHIVSIPVQLWASYLTSEIQWDSLQRGDNNHTYVEEFS